MKSLSDVPWWLRRWFGIQLLLRSVDIQLNKLCVYMSHFWHQEKHLPKLLQSSRTSSTLQVDSFNTSNRRLHIVKRRYLFICDTYVHYNCYILLFCVLISETAKTLINDDNARYGMIKVFEAVQNVRLNKHLFYVICSFIISKYINATKVATIWYKNPGTCSSVKLVYHAETKA